MTDALHVESDLRLGVDTGGTFTDFVLIDYDRGTTVLHKQLSTPADPSQAIIEGLRSIAERHGKPIARIGEIVHGTTLVTNALIERRGYSTGLLVTRGFTDLFDIGREQRYDLFDLRIQFAEPLVPRQMRREIAERIAADGSVVTPLDEDAVLLAVRDLVERQGIRALAICYLHSYANAAHEERTRQIVADAFPDLHVSTSADIFPYPREFERWTTTTVNAYVQPVLNDYLRRLEEGLDKLEFRGRLTLIGSSGGAMTPEAARHYPVRMLESGPAAGVLMSCRIGAILEMGNVLSFDLGGTTAKGALVLNGRALRKYEFEAARVYHHKSGSGLALRIPAIDLTEIGAGGGSLAQINGLGLLQVGPRSAGADPGPACYSRGGSEATLTDANLTLGYLNPGFFLGGKMKLDEDAAKASIVAKIAEPLGLDGLRAAWGIHETANEDIVRAFRLHATERGFDTRRAGMIAFGGGGPIHAARIARKLRIPRVIFPAGAGVMSALGMLTSRHAFEAGRSLRKSLASLDAMEFAAILDGVAREAAAALARMGTAEGSIGLSRRIAMRYIGQGFEIEVALPADVPSAEAFGQIENLFTKQYEAIYSFALDEAIEIVSWRAEAVGPEPHLPEFRFAPSESTVAKFKGTRSAWFPNAGGMIDCQVYDRYALVPGDVVEGPALVEENESTGLVDAGDVATVDRWMNIVVEIGNAPTVRQQGPAT